VPIVPPGDLRLVAPELLLTGLAFVVLLGAATPAGRRTRLGWLALASLLGTAVLVLAARGSAGLAAGPPGGFPDAAGYPTWVTDGFSLFFKITFLVSACLTVLMSLRYLDEEKSQRGEFYALLMLSVVGMMCLASGTDFTVLYIGLELMSLSTYVLVGFLRGDRRSNEGALKYFVLGAFSSGLLLYGISLVYGATGSTNLMAIRAAIATGGSPSKLLLAGAILVTAGLAFKVAAVPFHMWAPDAYEGAPTVVTAFMATGVKAAGFAMALRVFVDGFLGISGDWVPLVALLAAITMTVGNLAAVTQDNVKRMFAYSSIAHAGYALVGLVAVGAGSAGAAATVSGLDARAYGLVATALFLLIYVFTTVGAFGLVVLLRRGDIMGDRVEDFAGLASRAPLAAFTMLVFLLSLGGIPSTAGFIGKWWLFGSAVQSGYAWLAVLAVINSAISIFYYVRIAVQMYMSPVSARQPLATSPALTAALAACLAVTLFVGIYPAPFISIARTALLQSLR